MQIDRSDSSLVAEAWTGNKEALALLLQRHRPLLVALCRRMLGHPDRAEDAAQEAALEAMLSLDRLRRPERFGAWLGGIGLNVCRRRQQEQARECWSWEALHGGLQMPERADEQAGPEAMAEAAELQARVRAAVAGLPDGQRAAVLHFYLFQVT